MKRPAPVIRPDSDYELVKADDHAESGAWQVMVGGRRVGWVRPYWEGISARRVWQPVNPDWVTIRCTGRSATPRGNARTRDAAAQTLLMVLAAR